VGLEAAVDIAAHALWSGSGSVLLARRRPLTIATGLALVAFGLLPDLMHMLPVAAWSVFNGLPADFMTYTRALPERCDLCRRA